MIDALIQQGLTQKEAEIYISLVRYGSSRAESIYKNTKISRTLVYALLESLIKKGFVEKIIQNNKTYYFPNSPQTFLQRAKNQLSQAQVLVKELDNIKLVSSQPVIRTFQGFEGIEQMTDIFIEEAKAAGGEMLQMGQEIQFAVEYPELIESFIQKRVANKIPLKLLCNEFQNFDQYLNNKRDKKELREVRFVKKEDLDVDCTAYIYGDSMAVISLADEMQGYIFKSKNITDLNRKMFYLLWNKI